MKRPLTITLLSLLSFLLSIGGLTSSWATMSSSSGAEQIPLAVISFAYALAAAATSIGLWRCKAWVVPAFRIWVATFLTFIFAFIYSYSSMFADSMLAIVGFLFVVVAISFLLDKHLRNKLVINL